MLDKLLQNGYLADTNADLDPGIIVAPNGARLTQQHHPKLPITPEQLAIEAEQCQKAGAAMIHLHARDSSGRHSLEISDNQAAYQAVKQRVGDTLLVQMTTEAVGMYQPEQQMALVKALKPEAASFALRELIPNKDSIENASEFFHWVADHNILSQYIIYSAKELETYYHYVSEGWLPNYNHHLLIVLGRHNTDLESNPNEIIPFLKVGLDKLPCRWALCAFGKREFQCLATAALLGGDVRIGFENNIKDKYGNFASDNRSQVLSLLEIFQSLNIRPLETTKFREQLQLKPTCFQ